jgi:hypothetical protein
VWEWWVGDDDDGTCGGGGGGGVWAFFILVFSGVGVGWVFSWVDMAVSLFLSSFHLWGLVVSCRLDILLQSSSSLRSVLTNEEFVPKRIAVLCWSTQHS